MSVKVQIIKLISDGEQVSVEANLERRDFEQVEKGTPLLVHFKPYFDLVDDRSYEKNKRVQASGYYQKKLAKLSPEAYTMVIEIWDILHGRKDGRPVDEVIELDRLETELAIKAAKEKLESGLVDTPIGEIDVSEEEGTAVDSLDAPEPALQPYPEILKDTVS